MNAKEESSMKILKVCVTGYKLLEDDFELDFLNKARVSVSDKEDEIVELYENLFMPTTTIFTGKNSSGKSTVLSLLEFVSDLVYHGRIPYKDLDFRNDSIQLRLFFEINRSIYKYDGTIIKPEKNLLNEANYCRFIEERLYVKKYFKSYGKNILEQDFDEIMEFESKLSDTSRLYQLTTNKLLFVNTNAWFLRNSIAEMFYVFSISDVSNELILQIAQLFDDSIEHFTYNKDQKLYSLKLHGLEEKHYSESEVKTLLSDGTLKGLMLFGLVIATLKLGGSMMIDEIENSFHKNLVENIIMIFNDKRINKNKATLVFSTHYVEILDILRRRDSIYVMTKKNGYITKCNLHEDYDARTDLSKSNQFNNNTFATLINYERLMKLKKVLIREIPDSVRR
jgi:AAA15 family ATPase/GTPase